MFNNVMLQFHNMSIYTNEKAFAHHTNIET